MLIGKWLAESAKKLSSASVATASLDAEVLLAHVLGRDRAWLLAHPEHQLEPSELKKLDSFIQRRLKHEPVAYIIGSAEFYGRKFKVSEHTLVPRPESETMIEMCLDYLRNEERGTRNEELQIIDIGTGSGCLGITATLELRNLHPLPSTFHPFLIDIDPKCIEIAKRNAKSLGIDAKFYVGNLLQPWLQAQNEERGTRNGATHSSFIVNHSSLIIFANLPYVPEAYPVNEAAKHEPKLALFGGEDGLDFYREFYYQIAKFLQFDSKNLYIFTESLPEQHQKLAQIAAEHGFKQTAEQDFVQSFSQISN